MNVYSSFLKPRRMIYIPDIVLLPSARVSIMLNHSVFGLLLFEVGNGDVTEYWDGESTEKERDGK